MPVSGNISLRLIVINKLYAIAMKVDYSIMIVVLKVYFYFMKFCKTLFIILTSIVLYPADYSCFLSPQSQERSTHSILVNMSDCYVIISEFKLQSFYHGGYPREVRELRVD